QLELLVGRSNARGGLADGKDSQELFVRPVQRYEDLVVRAPCLGVVPDLPLWHVARADVVAPVEFALPDEIGAAAQEPLVEERPPAVPLVRAAEQRRADLLVTVHGGHAEIVPPAPVRVDYDGREAERFE